MFQVNCTDIWLVHSTVCFIHYGMTRQLRLARVRVQTHRHTHTSCRIQMWRIWIFLWHTIWHTFGRFSGWCDCDCNGCCRCCCCYFCYRRAHQSEQYNYFFSLFSYSHRLMFRSHFLFLSFCCCCKSFALCFISILHFTGLIVVLAQCQRFCNSVANLPIERQRTYHMYDIDMQYTYRKVHESCSRIK